MRKTTNIPKYDFTQKYNFIKGKFELSKIPIPYYMFSMPLHYIVEELSLVSQLHEVSLELFDVNNVFQRNIDMKRVEEQIVKGYLDDSEKIKFFNPITIAFLPKKENKIVDKYEKLAVPLDILKSLVDGTTETVEKFFTDSKNLSNIILLEEKDSDLGIICWDKISVNAIAIDGQHRLCALKEFYKTRPDTRDVLIPIIAIVFEDFTEKKLITYLREIFIDINKSAKPVKKTRNIILDDREISAILTKDLIYSDTKDTKGNENSIKSEVFDWQSDDPRPESPFQLTSIMIIHRIISETFLERKELRSDNSWDYNKINSFINMLNRKFNIDETITIPTLKLKHIAKETFDREGTFSLKKVHFDIILEKFRETIKPLFYRVYTEFAPYKEFMEKVNKLDIFNKDAIVNKYIRLPKESRENYIKEYHAQLKDGKIIGTSFVAEEVFSELIELKKDNLLFNIIGQLAIFRVIANGAYSLADEYTLNDFFQSINNILSKENIFNKYYKVEKRFFWDSLATQKKGAKISATSVSIDNIGDILILLVIIDQINKKDGIEANKIIEGNIDIFGNNDSPQNTFIRKLSTKIIGRLATEQRNLELDVKTNDDITALATVTYKKFILQIIEIIK